MRDLDQVKQLKKQKLKRKNLILYLDGESCYFMDNKNLNNIKLLNQSEEKI